MGKLRNTEPGHIAPTPRGGGRGERWWLQIAQGRELGGMLEEEQVRACLNRRRMTSGSSADQATALAYRRGG